MAALSKLSRRTKLLLLLKRRSERRKKYAKSVWVRKIFQQRKQQGEFHLLINELRIHDHEYFFKYFRMSPSKYEDLLRLVGPYITKSSKRREAIGPSEPFAFILYYLFACHLQSKLKCLQEKTNAYETLQFDWLRKMRSNCDPTDQRKKLNSVQLWLGTEQHGIAIPQDSKIMIFVCSRGF